MTADKSPRAREGLRARLIRNALLLAGGNGGAAILALGVVSVNSRALSLTEFGTYVLLQTSALLLAGLFAFATQQAVIKLGTAALEANDRPRFERILGMGFVADAASAVAAASSGWVLTLFFSSAIGLPVSALPAALIVASALLLQGFRTCEGIFRIYNRFDLLGMSQVAGTAVQLAVAIGLWYWQAPFNAYAVLIALGLILPVATQLATASLLLRRNGLRPRFGALLRDSSDRREFAAYCWTTGAIGTFEAMRQYGDAPLVGAMISVEASGIYNVAKQLAGVLRKGAAIYNSVLFPELATYVARNDLRGARHVLGKVVRLSGGVGFAAILASAMLGQFALGILFGPAFEAGYLVLILLCGATGLQLVSATYSMYAQAFVGPTSLVWPYVISTACFLIAMVGLAPVWGLLGAGMAQIAFFMSLTLLCRARLRSTALFRGAIREN